MIIFICGCCKSNANKGRKAIKPEDLFTGSDDENNFLDSENNNKKGKASRKKTKVVVYRDDFMINDEEKSSQDVDYDKLRKKANIAEAASVVGYDGKKIKKDLNKIIDAKEKEAKQYNDLGL